MSNWLFAVLVCVGLMAVGVWADEMLTLSVSAQPEGKDKAKKPAFRAGAVRYQVKDVNGSVEFYTKHLGFKKELAAPAFAAASNGNLTLWLSGPKSSGSRAMADGRKQEPGGWNRIVLEVDDLPSRVAELKKAGLRFRNEIEKGPGGMQIQLEDPDGNPVELFEPAR
jgi:glyoxylase I family protein